MVRRLLLPVLLLLLVACADQPAGTPSPTPTLPVGEVPTSEPVPQRQGKEEASPLATATPLAPTADAPAGASGSWTVLVYAGADNDLAQRVLEDLDELEAAGAPDGMNIVLQIDRGERADESGESWAGARRYLLAADQEPQRIGSTLLEEPGPVNMGDPRTLQAFIRWGRESYPAQHVALWLWGYGGDWRNMTADQSGADVLTLLELGEALAGALSGGPQLDLVALDTGYGDQLAALARLQPYARYALLSGGLPPQQGWHFQTLLAELQATSPADGSALAAAMAQHLPPAEAAPLASVTAVDLQGVAPLLAALQALGDRLQAEPALGAAAMADARRSARPFAAADPALSGEFAVVDLGRFAAILAQLSPDPSLAEAAAELHEAVQEAILAPEGNAALTLYFPATAGEYDGRYDELAAGGWRETLQAYYEERLNGPPAPVLSLSQVAGSTGGTTRPVFAAYELSGRALGEVRALVWQPGEVGARLVANEVLLPDVQRLPDGTPLRLWPDGVHEGFYVWDTRSPHLSDGAAGEFVIPWPAGPGDGLYTIAGQLAAPDGSSAQDAWLLLDRGSGALVRVLARPAGASGALRVVAPSPDALFSPLVYRQNSEGALNAEPGIALRFGEQGPAYSLQPLPSGEYELGFEARVENGTPTTAYAAVAVQNDDPGSAVAYLDPYHGFQFNLPAGWAMPGYEGQLLTGSDPAGTTTLAVRRYPDEGRRAGALKADTLAAFGAVDLLFEESRPVGAANGEFVAYGYDRDGEPRTGVFLAFVHEQVGYVVDMDGPAAAEANTLAIAEQIAASWTVRPVGLGVAPGLWRLQELPQLAVPVPERFQHQTLDNGWELFRDASSFVALRRDPATGQSRAGRVQHWLDVAAEGVTAFDQDELYTFLLAGRSWVRADFSYERDGIPVRGLVMLTVSDGLEHAAWAEAPAEQVAELLDGVLLAMIAGATQTTTCDQLLYSADFESAGAWGTGKENGGLGEVANGVYRLGVTAPQAFIWTTAGASLVDGVYEVSATQEEGPLDNGFGLLLRADAATGSFYVLEISGDGYVWIGRCADGCATMTSLVEEGWFAHEAVNRGPGATNRLRVVADGEQLRFYVNDQQVGATVDRTLSRGDVGLFVETLGEEGVTVSFDDLRVYAR